MPRIGYLTPSTFPDLMKTGRGGKGFGETALAVIDQLALDMMGTEPREEMTSAATEWGKEYEYLAREAYEEKNMVKVIVPDFTVSSDLAYVGGTCDGLVGKDLIIEIKCPFNSANHIAREKQLQKYIYQLQGYMWIYDRPKLHFISFDDRCRQEFKLLVDPVIRDEQIINDIKERCKQAYEAACKRVDELEKRYLTNESDRKW